MSKRRPATEAKLQRFAYELYRRRGEGMIVPLVEVQPEGWQPKEQACHANVDTWVLSTDGCVAVRGWLYVEHGARGFPAFLPVLRYPFIRDNSRPGEYARLVDRHKLEFLDYREP